ncbi:TIGR03085 family protein [Kocuria sediminis]|uniref:TIGR03085 family protein n=1 Tax=Kocuria sediminis TaxID=1038857 RepID=A0A6N8GK28_9MICC|nr:TIGR03085 family protein [Kocuria sediminis]
MTNFANVERRHLAALLRRLGPDAPTLCEGWTTRDLAVHLVLRDGRPDVLAGRALSRVPVLRDRARRAEEAVARQPWEELVRKVEHPPLYSPARLGPVDRRMNTVELFVHHEDARRAQPEWHDRPLLHDEEQALWQGLSLMAKVMLKDEEDTVVLIAPSYGAVRGGRGRTGTVRVLRAVPSELLLWAFGRRGQARVEETVE